MPVTACDGQAKFTTLDEQGYTYSDEHTSRRRHKKRKRRRRTPQYVRHDLYYYYSLPFYSSFSSCKLDLFSLSHSIPTVYTTLDAAVTAAYNGLDVERWRAVRINVQNVQIFSSRSSFAQVLVYVRVSVWVFEEETKWGGRKENVQGGSWKRETAVKLQRGKKSSRVI